MDNIYLATGNGFHLGPTNESEVIAAIVKISSKNSAGIDDIPCSLLRVCN